MSVYDRAAQDELEERLATTEELLRAEGFADLDRALTGSCSNAQLERSR